MNSDSYPSAAQRNDVSERQISGVSPLHTLRFEQLKESDPEMYDIFKSSMGLEGIRQELFRLLIEREMKLFSYDCEMESMERANSLHCIRVLKNIFSRRNERRSGHSTLYHVVELAREDVEEIQKDRRSLFLELYMLSRGSLSKADMPIERAPDFMDQDGREGAQIRSNFLDVMAKRCEDRMKSYISGLDPSVVKHREGSKHRILELLGGDADDWNDFKWHHRNVFSDSSLISEIVDLTEDERAAIDLAVENDLPFGITPYYLSLFDRDSSRKWDHAVRAQVIPPLSYVNAVLSPKVHGPEDLDFMKEGQTSPIDLVTRRYPMIAILKPYNTCAQICVYCQRNWEIDNVTGTYQAMAPRESIDQAIQWFREHPGVTEVLMTGGDPALMDDEILVDLLQEISDIEHVSRIRIGTRLPVVLPMRFTDHLVDTLGRFHHPPQQDLCIVTHFEHPYEITPEAVKVVKDLRMNGLAIYNQQVFTIENSRRFETAATRMLLKQIGVDPYYTFNTKGKEETSWYRVPISRIMQEREEEARLLPGLSRTDEPVFNIPALGKNHLRAWQNHDLIMISPRGERIYEFYPWEKNITTAPTYTYTDVPILDYLERLHARGEDIEEYRSIWYYF
ncbi:MAG: KamA family radical SAM protein [Euryarchaeota archaeon]|nr:KamA family radical SAM protein [Euryarchaeota archaeon]